MSSASRRVSIARAAPLESPAIASTAVDDVSMSFDLGPSVLPAEGGILDNFIMHHQQLQQSSIYNN